MKFFTHGLAYKCVALQCNLLLIFLLNAGQINAEEVCKFFYNGYPEDISGKEITVPEKTVAVSDYLLVGTPTKVIEKFSSTASIFFIIDHSSSMYNTNKDKQGHRFSVPYTLIDTIQKNMPNAEVGIAVFKQQLFFSEKDSPYFTKCPQWDTNSYLPLMSLKSTYNNNETGYDIAKRYLDSELKNGIAQLKYKPSISTGNSTNINCAFDAAKHAMRSSKNPKDRQFIIFFSDGLANRPRNDTKNNYIQGIDVPATFTIFFSPNNRVPASIQTMTNNIKENGYSESNLLTRCWGYNNTTADSLKNFLLENVFKAIFQKSVAEPQNIIVNGMAPAKKWDGKGFTFSNMFPLTGIKTDFSEEIRYTITTDSVRTNKRSDNAGTDTVITVEFAVKIKENAEKQENYIFECWDRALQFFHNNTPVEIADETMEELEIRFKEDKGDILYGYENVTVDISNTAAKQSDLETFKLEDKASHFSFTFKRAFASYPQRGDNKLSHEYADSIVATFRNPELPLDTLRLAIPFRISNTYGFKKGYYYDNNADGYIDSLFLECKERINENNARELIDFVTLPAHRDFEIITIHAHTNGIGLMVRQKDIAYNDRMVTNVTQEDVLVIKEGILPSGGLVFADTVEIIDNVAPIIMNAHLVKFEDPRICDTLIVTFSEPIVNVTNPRPFYFLSSADGLFYIADLRLQNSDETSMTFTVRSVEGVSGPVDRIHKMDSIWIYWEGKQVGDKCFNYQNNKNNRRRNLDIDQRYLNIALVPKGVNPYYKDNPEKHVISPDILGILISDNLADISNSSHPNSGMLLQVTPELLNNIDTKAITDFYLEGNVSIFDAAGNSIIKNKEMGFRENTKSLNYVWNGNNASHRTCGTGPYLASFKVTPYRGPNLTKLDEIHVTFIIIIK